MYAKKQKLAPTELAGANVTTYATASLKGNVTHHYRVRAYNVAGDSAVSNTSSAKTSAAADSGVHPIALGAYWAEFGSVYEARTLAPPRRSTSAIFDGYRTSLRRDSAPRFRSLREVRGLHVAGEAATFTEA